MWITEHEDQQLNVLYELKQVGMILAVFLITCSVVKLVILCQNVIGQNDFQLPSKRHFAMQFI